MSRTRFAAGYIPPRARAWEAERDVLAARVEMLETRVLEFGSYGDSPLLDLARRRLAAHEAARPEVPTNEAGALPGQVAAPARVPLITDER
jgi:hypothetical protein